MTARHIWHFKGGYLAANKIGQKFQNFPKSGSFFYQGWFLKSSMPFWPSRISALQINLRIRSLASSLTSTSVGKSKQFWNGKTIYCVQPFISETTRCVSNDFIENNDNSGQNVVRFYVWRIERGRELPSGETEKEEVWERESLWERRIAWVQRSGHTHKQLTEM